MFRLTGEDDPQDNGPAHSFYPGVGAGSHPDRCLVNKRCPHGAILPDTAKAGRPSRPAFAFSRRRQCQPRRSFPLVSGRLKTNAALISSSTTA